MEFSLYEWMDLNFIKMIGVLKWAWLEYSNHGMEGIVLKMELNGPF